MTGQYASAMPGATPPPPPAQGGKQYYISINGQTNGPFSLDLMLAQIAGGTITPQTYVWHIGMPAWTVASGIPELAMAFGSVTPPPPPHMP